MKRLVQQTYVGQCQINALITNQCCCFCVCVLTSEINDQCLMQPCFVTAGDNKSVFFPIVSWYLLHFNIANSTMPLFRNWDKPNNRIRFSLFRCSVPNRSCKKGQE